MVDVESEMRPFVGSPMERVGGKSFVESPAGRVGGRSFVGPPAGRVGGRSFVGAPAGRAVCASKGLVEMADDLDSSYIWTIFWISEMIEVAVVGWYHQLMVRTLTQ